MKYLYTILLLFALHSLQSQVSIRTGDEYYMNADVALGIGLTTPLNESSIYLRYTDGIDYVSLNVLGYITREAKVYASVGMKFKIIGMRDNLISLHVTPFPLNYSFSDRGYNTPIQTHLQFQEKRLSAEVIFTKYKSSESLTILLFWNLNKTKIKKYKKYKESYLATF